MKQGAVNSLESLKQLCGYLESDPENLALREAIFDQALQAGCFDEARHHVDYALEKRCDSHWLNKKGLLHLALGEYEEAANLYAALQAQGYQDAGIRFNLAYALFGLGDIAGASEGALPLLGEESICALAWPLWLRCQHRMQHFQEALSAFREASLSEQDYREAYGVASLLALDFDCLEECGRWAAIALRARPQQVEALVSMGTLALGEQASSRAAHLFQQVLAINASDGRSWSGLAFARMLEQDLGGAMEAFDKAVEAMPDHAGTWIGMGWCAFLSGDSRKCQHAFKKAIALDRNFAESHGGLGVALASQKRFQEARQCVELALSLDKQCLSARFASSMMNGEGESPEAMMKALRQSLAAYTLPEGGKTLSDAVFKGTPHADSH